MRERLYALGLFLALSLLVLSGCTVSQAQTTIDTPPVAETLEPTPVNVPNAVFARDAALAYVRENYQHDLKEMIWTEQNLTQEGLVGGSTFRYSASDWTVEVSFPVVNPADTVYKVAVANEAIGFAWQGEVDSIGQVDELRNETSEWFDPIRARDAALAFLRDRYGERAPRLDLVWDENDTTPGAPEKPLPGANELQYVSRNWTIALSYPVVRPDLVEYRVVVLNEPAGFRWEGKVTADGEVIDQPVAVGDQPVVAWFGRVVSLPAGSQFDDYLSLMPEGAGEIGVEGASAAIEAQIVALRDQEAPKYGNFWGTLRCDVIDYGGCQLLVTRVRFGMEMTDPEPVESWEGTIVELFYDEPGAHPNDAFIQSGDYPVQYGIASYIAENGLPVYKEELERLRDTGQTIRVWGQLICGFPDVNGCQIQVNRIEVASEPATPVQVPDPAMARDAAMAYLADHYRGLAPVPVPDWHEQDGSAEGLIGQSTLAHRGKEWIVTVSFPLVNPAATVYRVTIDNEANGFGWEGEVNATGQVTEQSVSGDIEPLLVDPEEWRVYYSKRFGYAFRFPGDCAVVSKNLDEALQVSTATTTGEGWPCLSVTHYDSDFYHPPTGTDLKQWLIDWEIHHDEMDTDLEIAGLPTVHLATKESQGAYAYDEYYSVKGEQLFRILIVHCGRQDWDLYNIFLSSFVFPGA